MEAQLQQNNDRVRELYFEDQIERAISNEREAYALGASAKTVSNWKNPNLPQCNVTVGAVPLSLSREKLLRWLASECGCAFIPCSGEYNGASTEEVRAIGEAFARLYEEKDPAKRLELYERILSNAARARKEEGL